MYLAIYNKVTDDLIEKIQYDEWFDAVKHVEENKDALLAQGIEEVKIRNSKNDDFCLWKLEKGKNKSILKDEIHPSMSGKRRRKKQNN